MDDFDFGGSAGVQGGQPQDNGFGDFGAPPAAPQPQTFAPPKAAAPTPNATQQPDFGGEEPPLEKFQRELRARIQAKDADSQKKSQAVRAEAKAYLEKQRAERSVLIQGKKAANDNEEAAKIARRDELFSVGTTWQRVVSMVDLSPDEKKSKKVGRMKEIFSYMQKEGK